MDFDAAWCPVCMLQIEPKRYHIPVEHPTQPAPAPPPSSPQSSRTSSPAQLPHLPLTSPPATAKPAAHPRKSKGLRTKSGLVQGTGRLRPNGTIKRSDSQSKPQPPPPAVKYRTVIDQGPIPLYCSDDCRLADLGSQHSGRPLNPNRDDLLSVSPDFDSPKIDEQESPSDLQRFPPSLLKLAQYYNFPSLPPPMPVFSDESSSDSDNYGRDYSSGIMMAGQRIRDFCPKPKKHTGFYPPPEEPKKHVPGWTDNSQGWRSSVYSMSAATSEATRTITPATMRASRQSSSSSTSSHSYSPVQVSDEELLSKYSESFSRRAEARGARSSKASSPARSTSSSRRERSLLPPGVEGKLAVPDIKLKVNSASNSSISSAWSATGSPSSKRSSVRSPLSISSNFADEDETDTQRCDSAASLPTQFKRPTVESESFLSFFHATLADLPSARSWSYDNIKTYPLMPMKPKMVKRKEKKIVDGEEVIVEVEVEEPLKRLFLFPAPTRLS
ncbi:hypothetical protein FA15DRAFT_149252 [Coprinopsis marcescibilis]|uniref:Uncharacterized protein n=1 Tax=Coprinopsis marcescibilis TaxID=230819 RepID=A0A5C3L587_COPMA|nr:hypothetical protein FA15DRAFT_149252 [Coprinopsis marcescibilis]